MPRLPGTRPRRAVHKAAWDKICSARPLGDERTVHFVGYAGVVIAVSNSIFLYLIPWAVYLLCYVVAFVIVISRWKQAPSAARLALIGLFLMFGTQLAVGLISIFGFRLLDVEQIMVVNGVVQAIGGFTRGVGLLLIVLAVFASRPVKSEVSPLGASGTSYAPSSSDNPYASPGT